MDDLNRRKFLQSAGVAGIAAGRPDLDGRCRFAGVMNNINYDDFSTQIMISKFRSAIFSDFQRFSKSLKIAE